MNGEEAGGAPAFSKAQLLSSRQFAPVQKDALRALLKANETYTLDQARALVGKFAKRKVR